MSNALNSCNLITKDLQGFLERALYEHILPVKSASVDIPALDITKLHLKSSHGSILINGSMASPNPPQTSPNSCATASSPPRPPP